MDVMVGGQPAVDRHTVTSGIVGRQSIQSFICTLYLLGFFHTKK